MMCLDPEGIFFAHEPLFRALDRANPRDCFTL